RSSPSPSAPPASNTHPRPRPTRVPPASEARPVPGTRSPVPSWFELLRCLAPKQVTRRIAFQAVADAAQVAHQATQFGQRRAHLCQPVVGVAVDRGAVLVD